MTDGFKEVFQVRRGEERLNDARWQPVGTLAARVLVRSRWPYLTVKHHSGSFVIGTGPMGGEDGYHAGLTLASEDGLRLRAHGSWRSPHPGRRRDLVQLGQVRVQIEPTLHAPEQTRKGTGYLFATVAFMDDLTPKMLRWNGIQENEEQFVTTPAGAVLLSGLYGFVRGCLRACQECGVFVVSQPKGRARLRCDDCEALRQGRARAGETRKLAFWRAREWNKVQDVMRKRGFTRLAKQLGQAELTAAQRTEWKHRALAGLHDVKSRQELNGWRKMVVPEGKPGRPKGK